MPTVRLPVARLPVARLLGARLAGAVLGAALARGGLAAGRAATGSVSTGPGTTSPGTTSPGTTSPDATSPDATSPEYARTDRWTRTNYRGAAVTLLAGPAYAAGAAAGTALTPGLRRDLRAAAGLAIATSGAVGLLDDLAGTGDDRGLRGHLAVLRRGEITTGTVKVAGLVASGVAAARLLGHRGADAAVSGAVVAGSANLLNLLDLRPGRATKVALLHTPLLLAAGPGATALAAPLGAAAALLPADLGERTMLGDAGANALGAALGVAAIASYGRLGRLVHLAGLVALTLASERVSFTRVVEATAPLRWLDGLGRRR